jgi:hypothetical protein
MTERPDITHREPPYEHPNGQRAYEERLRVPWWWWLLAMAAAAALTVPFGLAMPGGPAVAAAVVVMAVAAAATGLWWLGRVRVAVADEVLLVDDARLPLRFVADAIPLDAAARRQLLGPAADPLAFVVQRPWLSGAVQVILADPADPTPYWLVSTAAPERLTAVLTGARTG